jgi:hypothetical protein
MRRTVISILLMMISAMVHAEPESLAFPQDVAEVVRGTQGIPKKFKTYSLFLVCNPEWLAPEKSAGLYQLYRQFQNFGRTIGDEHVAVWFWKTKSDVNDQALAQNIDVERSVRFCQAWKLRPSAGPHLVVTSTYPDESHLSSGLPKNSAVYELGSMSPKDISELLAKLTDELVVKGSVDAPAAAPDAKPDLWVRLLVATQRTLNSFGCAWNFKINAGPVSADLHSCPASPGTEPK